MDRDSMFFTRNVILIIAIGITLVMAIIAGVIMLFLNTRSTTQVPTTTPSSTPSTQVTASEQQTSRDDLRTQLGQQTYDEVISRMNSDVASRAESLSYRENSLVTTETSKKFILDDSAQQNSYLVSVITTNEGADTIIYISCADYGSQKWGGTRCVANEEVSPPLSEL